MSFAHPKVSVIVPIYKVERYLPQCLDSIVNQTLDDIEIICVNDGSPDGSMAILKDYASRDSRIIIVDQTNQGLSAARNNAMQIAKGDYIAFCDSDDWLEREALEFLTAKADKDQLDMLSFSACLVDDRTGEKSYYEYTDFSQLRYDFQDRVFNYRDMPGDFFSIWRLPVTAWGTLWRRALIEQYQIRFPVGLVFEDILFFRMVLFRAERISAVNTVFYNYRQREGSITCRKSIYFNSMCEIYVRLYRFIETLRMQDLLESYVIDEVSMELNWLFIEVEKKDRKNAYRMMSRACNDIFRQMDLDKIKDRSRSREIRVVLKYPTVFGIKLDSLLSRIMAKLAPKKRKGVISANCLFLRDTSKSIPCSIWRGLFNVNKKYRRICNPPVLK